VQLAKRNKLQVIIDNKLDKKTENLLRGNSWRVGLFGMNDYWLKKELEGFGKKAFIVKVYSTPRGELLAAAVYLTTDDGAYYMQNGSTELGRKLMAPTLAVWEGMKEAKKRGLKYFDFDGVSDERHPIKAWAGFTRFKEGFGGEAVYYPAALVKHSLLGILW
jgi:lipid II:glycine glycyltransferase (peptidoglycan interpeptide bridge formation enzyme)